jgi:hypothetical protein
MLPAFVTELKAQKSRIVGAYSAYPKVEIFDRVLLGVAQPHHAPVGSLQYRGVNVRKSQDLKKSCSIIGAEGFSTIFHQGRFLLCMEFFQNFIRPQVAQCGYLFYIGMDSISFSIISTSSSWWKDFVSP